MASSREYPERPVIGVGGVVIDQERAVLIRRGSEPLLGEWSIPGGTLEIEVFDRIYQENRPTVMKDEKKPRFHYVIADYLCERIGGDPRAGSDVTDLAFAGEDDLARFHLTETATRILKKAFAMYRSRNNPG